MNEPISNSGKNISSGSSSHSVPQVLEKEQRSFKMNT